MIGEFLRICLAVVVAAVPLSACLWLALKLVGGSAPFIPLIPVSIIGLLLASIPVPYINFALLYFSIGYFLNKRLYAPSVITAFVATCAGLLLFGFMGAGFIVLISIK